jgi:hypothetical protein
MEIKPRGRPVVGEGHTERLIARCQPKELIRWKADAVRAGRRFSAHVRFALNQEHRRLGGDEVVAARVVPVEIRVPPAEEVQEVRIRGQGPSDRVSSGPSSGCPADVSKGVRCRLCKKIH